MLATINLLALALLISSFLKQGEEAGWKSIPLRLYGVAIVFTAIIIIRIQSTNPDIAWEGADLGRLRTAYVHGHMTSENVRAELLGSFGNILPEVSTLQLPAGTPRILVSSELFLWGISIPLETSGWEPSFIWRSVKESPSISRLAIRFKQGGFGAVLYDSDSGRWDRSRETPYWWSMRMVKLYKTFVRTHMSIRAHVNCELPGFGQQWLLLISPKNIASNGRITVLPGMDTAFASPALPADRSSSPDGALRIQELVAALSDVTQLKAIYGSTLIINERYKEGYEYVRQASEEGWGGCYEQALLYWSLTSRAHGKLHEAAAAYALARKTYLRWRLPPYENLHFMRWDKD